jgi:rubrerythrin
MIENLTLDKALEFAILTEQNGAKFYDRMATKHAGDDELTELFQILARDEEVHEMQFKALAKKLPEGRRTELSESDQATLRALVLAEHFNGNYDVLNKVDEMKTRDDALARAMELERSTLLYYHEMRQILGGSEVLDEIIAAEKDHLNKVMRLAVTGAKMRGLTDPFVASH